MNVSGWPINFGAGAPCKSNCRFCFIRQNPQSSVFSTPYQTTAQINQQISEACVNKIRNFIFWSEPQIDFFSSPYAYEIIDLLNDYKDCEFTIFTNGTLIDKSKIKDILLPNIKWAFSLHTFDMDLRDTIASFNNLETILEILPEIKGCVFVEPLFDFKVFAEDLKTLRKIGFNDEIVVRRIEHTKYASQFVKELSISSCEIFYEAIHYVSQNFDNVTYAPQIPQLERYSNSVIRELGSQLIDFIVPLYGKQLILTSELAFDWVNGLFAPNQNIDVHYIKNNYYGGSISCAGLLTRRDLFETLKNFNLDEYVNIILPMAMKTPFMGVKCNLPIDTMHPADNYEDLIKIDKTNVIFAGVPTA